MEQLVDHNSGESRIQIDEKYDRQILGKEVVGAVETARRKHRTLFGDPCSHQPRYGLAHDGHLLVFPNLALATFRFRLDFC